MHRNGEGAEVTGNAAVVTDHDEGGPADSRRAQSAGAVMRRSASYLEAITPLPPPDGSNAGAAGPGLAPAKSRVTFGEARVVGARVSSPPEPALWPAAIKPTEAQAAALRSVRRTVSTLERQLDALAAAGVEVQSLPVATVQVAGAEVDYMLGSEQPDEGEADAGGADQGGSDDEADDDDSDDVDDDGSSPGRRIFAIPSIVEGLAPRPLALDSVKEDDSDGSADSTGPLEEAKPDGGAGAGAASGGAGGAQGEPPSATEAPTTTTTAAVVATAAEAKEPRKLPAPVQCLVDGWKATRRSMLMLIAGSVVGVIYATQRLEWPVGFAFYWVAQTALTVGYGDTPPCVDDGTCRRITDNAGDMVFVIFMSCWLLVPVTALLSQYLDMLLTSERKAKAATQMAYLKSYKAAYKEQQARARASDPGAGGAAARPEDLISNEMLAARCSEFVTPDALGDTLSPAGEKMTKEERQSFIVETMKRRRLTAVQQWGHAAAAAAAAATAPGDATAPEASADAASALSPTSTVQRKRGTLAAIGALFTDHGDDDEGEWFFKTKRSYTLFINVVIWLIVAAVGIAWFIAYEESNFWEALYWVVITGLAVGYGDVVVSDETGYWLVCFYMIIIVATSYAILGKVASAIRPGNGIEEALEKTFDIETMKAIDRNNDGEVEKHEYLSAVLVMLDRIDFETCNLILEHYDDLAQGNDALVLENWNEPNATGGIAHSVSFMSKIGEGAQAAKAKLKAVRAASSMGGRKSKSASKSHHKSLGARPSDSAQLAAVESSPSQHRARRARTEP